MLIPVPCNCIIHLQKVNNDTKDQGNWFTRTIAYYFINETCWYLIQLFSLKVIQSVSELSSVWESAGLQGCMSFKVSVWWVVFEAGISYRYLLECCCLDYDSLYCSCRLGLLFLGRLKAVNRSFQPATSLSGGQTDNLCTQYGAGFMYRFLCS